MNKLSTLFFSVLSLGLVASCSGEKKENTETQTQTQIEKKPIVRVNKVSSKDVEQTREIGRAHV